jgi:hypothetical protein
VFAFVGDGQGSYVKQALGIYQYVGTGLGSYVAARAVPIPQLSQLFDMSLETHPTKFLTLQTEGAFSQFNANQFSNDSQQSGQAYKIGFILNPKNVQLFGQNVGNLDVSASQRFQGKTFTPIDRTNVVDFNRQWDLSSVTASTAANEFIRNFSTSYEPVKQLKIGYGFGSIDRDTLFNSKRQEFSIAVKQDSLLTSQYNAEYITSHDGELAQQAYWVRQKARIDYQIYLSKLVGKESPFAKLSLMPFISYEAEDKRTKSTTLDTLTTDSFSFVDVQPGIRIPNFWNQILTLQVGFRDDKKMLNGSVQDASHATTVSFEHQLLPWNNFSSNLNFTQRALTYTPLFRTQAGNSNNETFILRWLARYTPFRSAIDNEFYYEVTTEKTSRLDRVFVRVATGTGQYAWNPATNDLNHNGVADFNEFVPARFPDEANYVLQTYPSDVLIPVIDLKASIRLKLKPQRLLSNTSGFWNSAIAALSTETLLRVEEKSSESDLKKIYLLDFSRFQTDTTTIAGTNTITQDVYLFENDPTNVRFRFSQIRSQNQYSISTDKRLSIERSIRFISRAGYELGFELDLTSGRSRLRSIASGNIIIDSTDSRNTDITFTRASPDISYRPFQDLELGFKFTLESRTDGLPVPPATANLNTENLRAVYSFRGKGRLSAELERTEVQLKIADGQLPSYELTNGNAVGQNYVWRLNFDYRVNNFVTATISYDGRTNTSIGNVINTGKAEVRAFF